MPPMKTQFENLLPLTQSQLTLWTGQQMHPNVPLHDVVYTFDINGTLNESTFEKAFQILVSENDIFKTIFIDRKGTPHQGVNENTIIDFKILDFGHRTKEEIHSYIKEQTLKPLNVSRQVYESRLLKINKNRYIWYLKLHHLVTDAVTFSILYNRMATLYGDLLQEKNSIPPESASFSDYVQYEQELQHSKINESYKKYWANKVSKDIQNFRFYGEKEDSLSTEAERIEISIGSLRTEKLKELANKSEVRGWTHDLTLFNIFATLYSSFLYRTSGHKSLVIGSPAHNRSERRFHRTAGLFIEVLPYSIEIEDNDTFNTLMQRIKVESNSFLKNAGPGMTGSVKERNISALLNFITADFPDFNGHPTKIDWVHNEHIDSAHSIRCHVYDFQKNGDYRLAFDIKKTFLRGRKSVDIANHFLKLLDACLDNIDKPIEEIELVSADEKQTLIGSHQEIIKPEKSVLERFEKWASEKPNGIAIQFEEQTLTYSNLNKKANRLARYLKAKNIDHRSIVTVHFNRSPEYIIAILAVLKTGAAFVPIASDQPRARLEYIYSNSNSSLMVTDRNFQSKVSIDTNEIINIHEIAPSLDTESSKNLDLDINKDDLSYILYTSGSTGKPKGVKIANKSLANYLNWAQNYYQVDESSVFALFTSIGFDLTITSTFLPIINGGRMIIYQEYDSGPDTALLRVVEDNQVNAIKLTPSHLSLLKGKTFDDSSIHTMILGGEDLKVSLAQEISASFSKKLRIFNEYGPTEATVGCIASEFDPIKHIESSVPIGHPIENIQAYIFDDYMNLVPNGVSGELFIGGVGLAKGYIGDSEMTLEKFIDNPYDPGSKLYKSGDLVRLNKNGEFEYLGRKDDQVKLRGHRIELSEIEANLNQLVGINNSTVVLVENEQSIPEEEVVNCTKCGLPSNYPSTDFDDQGVCHLCRAFDTYKEKAHRYFKNDEQLVSLLSSKRDKSVNYDCISLLSGGKDSTYVLARLINMGLNVLAFTMDNGYISEQAKANIDRIVTRLGVDHVYGKTPHMNEIFVDSLHRHKNVCNGCFKTIYTLSTKIALEKNIPFIVTGLSRGQFFETRLTEELFWDDDLDTTKIDQTILEARKLYHQESDAVKKLLDTSMFDDDETFEKVQFVDFYRFSDVSLEEMLVFLKEKAEWVRPTDTGRSTNCLINQVGIYVHKKELGYSNYSFPYSWDVRLGHKTRNESLEEINEVIDEIEVKRIIQEIGYNEIDEEETNSNKLVAYYTGNPDLSINEIQTALAKELPSYMVPSVFKHLTEIPLTKNGKVDKAVLKNLSGAQLEMDTPYVAPRNEIEELVEGIWKEVLQLKKVGVHDDFIALGGHSLAAIRVTARINEEIEMNFPLNKVFEHTTIASYASYIEQTLTALLEK